MAISWLVPRRRWLRSSAPLLLIPAFIAGPGRGMMRPFFEADPARSLPTSDVRLSDLPTSTSTPDNGKPVWPDERLEGQPARRILLHFLTEAGTRLNRIGSYTAVLLKRERLDGVVGPDETMEIKVRHHPFAVYLKYRGRKKGREVIYAEGKNDNKLVAHTEDWTSRLIPRLILDPTSTLAMVDNRHPITEAGLAHLMGKLIAASRADLEDPEVVTVLDRVSEDGRSWLRSTQTYSQPNADRPLSRVEVCYDPETGFPLRFRGDEWPAPGQPRQLGESYRYDDLRLEAGLTDRDFDADNPAYAFVRN